MATGTLQVLGRLQRLKEPVWVTALAVVLGVISLFKGSSYDLYLLELPLIYIAAASGMNLAVGYAGEFVLSQAGIMGAAAYFTGIFAEHLVPLGLAAPVSVIAGVAFGVLSSMPGLRLRGFYIGTVTFLVSLVFADVILLWPSLTGGSNGITGIIPNFVGGRGLFFIALVVAWASVCLGWRVRRSGWGLRLLALRDAPLALSTSGVQLSTTALITYTVASIPPAIAGWLLAYVNESVTPANYGLQLTLLLFAGVMLGGAGTVFGPLLGVSLLEIYSTNIGQFSAWNEIGLGVVLVVAIILFPSGIAGAFASLFERFRGRWSAPPTEVALAVTAPATHRGVGKTGSFDGLDDLVDGLEGVDRDRRSSEIVQGRGAAIKVHRLSKHFEGVAALDEVSIEIHGGRITAIVGANGSGKTTLINVITGFLKPTRGQVFLDEEIVTGLPPSRMARRGVARTFQLPQLIGELSPIANVEIGLLSRHRESIFRVLFRPRKCAAVCAEREKVAAGILRPVLGAEDAGVLLARRSESLPLAAKRVVEVGRALARDASVVFLDEPASGLNDGEKENLAIVLHRVRRSGRTIVLVEHDLRFALALADDVVLLDHGQVAAVARDHKQEGLPEALVRYVETMPRDQQAPL